MILQIVAILAFGSAFKCNIYQLAYVCSGVAMLSALVTFMEVKKMINYTFIELFYDIFKPIVASIIMGGIIFLSNYGYRLSPFIQTRTIAFIIKVLVGMISYLILSIVLKMESFYALNDILKEKKV